MENETQTGSPCRGLKNHCLSDDNVQEMRSRIDFLTIRSPKERFHYPSGYALTSS
jgi:hypothetical protein